MQLIVISAREPVRDNVPKRLFWDSFPSNQWIRVLELLQSYESSICDLDVSFEMDSLTVVTWYPEEIESVYDFILSSLNYEHNCVL